MIRVRFSSFKFPYRPLLLAFGAVYLAFHVLHGERGLYALFKQRQMREVLQQDLAVTKKKREALEMKARYLRDDSIDLDLLDEQVRRMLGGVNDNERLVLLNHE